MEREIKFDNCRTLDEAIAVLMKAQLNGEHVYGDFGGYILHSDGLTVDSAYQQVMGYTKKEWDKIQKQIPSNYDKKEKERKKREEEIAKMIEEDRMANQRELNGEIVIDGLKFIAEHRFLTHDELAKGLLELGYNFTLKQIKDRFPTISDNVYEGIHNAEIGWGASILAKVRDSEDALSFADEKFLSVDDNISIYHFIRMITGEEDYTKENIENKVRNKQL